MKSVILLAITFVSTLSMANLPANELSGLTDSQINELCYKNAVSTDQDRANLKGADDLFSRLTIETSSAIKIRFEQELKKSKTCDELIAKTKTIFSRMNEVSQKMKNIFESL